MITVSDALTRLESLVPAVEGTPSIDQYETALSGAVAALNRKHGRIKRCALSVVMNTAVYTLPADFQKIVRMESFNESAYNGVMLTGQGIIPFSPGFREKYTAIDGQLTIIPTPSYTATRYLWYKAAHVVEVEEAEVNPITEAKGEEVYAEMTGAEYELVLIKAQANLWRSILGRISVGEAIKYTVGDFTVDSTNLATAGRNYVQSLDAQFDDGVKDFIGPVGRRG